MRFAFALLLVVHGLIHLLGPAKAFGLLELPELSRVSRPAALLWLACGLGFASSGVLLLASPGRWWWTAAPALVLSQALVFLSWQSAKAGTIANAIILVPLALTLLDLRAGSLRSTFHRDVREHLARSAPGPVVTDADLAPLPPLVRAYLQRVGVVGRPRPGAIHVVMSGRMRASESSPWMDIRAEQYSFLAEPTRLFFVEGSMFGVPFHGLHEYVGPSATMRIRAAGLFRIADARGPEMNQGETVTMFNDLCLLAPGGLLGAPVTWEEAGPRSVRATFTNAGNTIRATLTFDDAGDLVGFVSDDRYLSATGDRYDRHPWSTPVTEYGDFHGLHLTRRGRAVWLLPSGELEYAEFLMEDIRTDPASTER